MGKSSKSAKAYRRIKVLIEDGHLKVGQRVPEAKMAELVGMSRGPVRESLLRLEAEGLLRHKGSRRSRVVAYTEDQDPQELLHRYEAREQIESGAARLAAMNMTGWQIERLRTLAQRAKEALNSEDRQPRYETNNEFLQFLFAHCGNPLLLEMWQTHRLTPTQPRSPELEDRIKAGVPEGQRGHPFLVDVVDAIAAHDSDLAEALMKKRVRRITEAIRKVVLEGNFD